MVTWTNDISSWVWKNRLTDRQKQDGTVLQHPSFYLFSPEWSTSLMRQPTTQHLIVPDGGVWHIHVDPQKSVYQSILSNWCGSGKWSSRMLVVPPFINDAGTKCRGGICLVVEMCHSVSCAKFSLMTSFTNRTFYTFIALVIIGFICKHLKLIYYSRYWKRTKLNERANEQRNDWQTDRRTIRFHCDSSSVCLSIGCSTSLIISSLSFIADSNQ